MKLSCGERLQLAELKEEEKRIIGYTIKNGSNPLPKGYKRNQKLIKLQQKLERTNND